MKQQSIAERYKHILNASSKGTRDQDYAYLNLIIAVPLILKYLDRIEGTTAYKQKLKFHAKGLLDELTSLDSALNEVWEADSTGLYYAMDGQEIALEFIASLKPDQLLAIAENGIEMNYTEEVEETIIPGRREKRA